MKRAGQNNNGAGGSKKKPKTIHIHHHHHDQQSKSAQKEKSTQCDPTIINKATKRIHGRKVNLKTVILDSVVIDSSPLVSSPVLISSSSSQSAKYTMASMHDLGVSVSDYNQTLKDTVTNLIDYYDACAKLCELSLLAVPGDEQCLRLAVVEYKDSICLLLQRFFGAPTIQSLDSQDIKSFFDAICTKRENVRNKSISDLYTLLARPDMYSQKIRLAKAKSQLEVYNKTLLDTWAVFHDIKTYILSNDDEIIDKIIRENEHE